MKRKEIQISVNEIVEIAFGTLLNQPSISFFNQICDEVSEVKKGDLFVACASKDSQKEIEEAVQKGAFGILFSGNIAMSDSEVAWISVEDLEQSLVRIARHYLIVGNKILFLLHFDEYQIASQIIIPKKNLGYYCGSLVKLIRYILTCDVAYILYCNSQINLNVLPKNQQEIKLLPQEKIEDENLPFAINSYSLFGIKIFYKTLDYEIPLPKLFIQPLARVLRFSEEYSSEVQMKNLEGISSFKPLYLDERGFISKPGATNKVLLACMDIKLYEQYLAYFTMYAKWARLMLFVPQIYQEIYAPYAEVRCFENHQELFELLICEKYNFALIFGVKTEIFEEKFTNNTHEQSLFEYAYLETESQNTN
ncbi:hypothetical protein [uncultured Helicobacter sp.]|uniref:hypothetical protein n=1 Tax=uncultured Helicobacter sp. TaxID=175537 RepID=UPI00260F5852|nr:hypothetical protein [uncultured Helicobacter sp.]